MNILSFSRHLKVIIAHVLLHSTRGLAFDYSSEKLPKQTRQVSVLCLAGFLRFGRLAMLIVIFGALCIGLTGCYSFTGGSIPPHLKTLAIPLADDASNFGNAQIRENLTQQVVQAFRRENAFRLVQERPDAVLEMTITGVVENTATVQQGEQERDKQIIINVNVVYQDRVKQKQIWAKQFGPPQTYAIAAGLQGRDAAITRALRQIANDILLQVVSGW